MPSHSVVLKAFSLPTSSSKRPPSSDNVISSSCLVCAPPLHPVRHGLASRPSSITRTTASLPRFPPWVPDLPNSFSTLLMGASDKNVNRSPPRPTASYGRMSTDYTNCIHLLQIILMLGLTCSVPNEHFETHQIRRVLNRFLLLWSFLPRYMISFLIAKLVFWTSLYLLSPRPV